MERMYIVILLVGVSIVDVNAWWIPRPQHNHNSNTGDATEHTQQEVEDKSAVVEEQSEDVETSAVVVEEQSEDVEEAIEEAKESCAVKNVALNIAAEMSSLQGVDYLNLEQEESESLCSSTWWSVDLGRNYILKEVKVYNENGCCKGNAKSIDILVGETPDNKKRVGKVKKFKKGRDNSVKLKNVKGRYVELVQTSNNLLQLCEIEVLGIPEICHMPNRCKNGGVERTDDSELGYKCGCVTDSDYMFRGDQCEDAWVKVPNKLKNALLSSLKAEIENPK